MSLRRVKARTKGVTGYVNCARGSLFGNPFPLSRYNLELSLSLFRIYLDWRIKKDPMFNYELAKIAKRAEREEVTLGCTCKLESKCHVDIIIEELKNRYSR